MKMASVLVSVSRREEARLLRTAHADSLKSGAISPLTRHSKVYLELAISVVRKAPTDGKIGPSCCRLPFRLPSVVSYRPVNMLPVNPDDTSRYHTHDLVIIPRELDPAAGTGRFHMLRQRCRILVESKTLRATVIDAFVRLRALVAGEGLTCGEAFSARRMSVKCNRSRRWAEHTRISDKGTSRYR